jgi:hypothetical protein
MAVDPVFVVMMPTPMSRNPNPISPTDVVARPMDIIRPVTNLDIYNDSIYHGRHCCKHCQKYPNFPFHTCNFISDSDDRRTPFIRESKQVAQAPGKSAIDVVTCGMDSRISGEDV